VRDSATRPALACHCRSSPLGEDRYYKRSGDSFYKMEHFDIEDMLGRRQKPKLSVITYLNPVEDDDSQQELQFHILNEGRALAKHVGFLVQFENLVITLVSGAYMYDATKLNHGRPVVSYNNDINVVHPNGIPSHVGNVRVRRVDPTKGAFAKISYYCADASPGTLKLEMPSLDRSVKGQQ
jgi:hypothetical protein